MQKMQDEMMRAAKFDGGYPRLVVMPIGILALARNEAEWVSLRRISHRGHMVFAVGLGAIAACALGFVCVIVLRLHGVIS